MLSCGDVNQWKPGYPTEEIIRNDIEAGQSYAVVDEDAAVDGGVVGEGSDAGGAVVVGGWASMDGSVVDEGSDAGGAAIVGAFAFIPGVDPTYAVVYGGAWIDDELPYATIHRLASTMDSHGVASACFDWCWSQIHNLRIDTHEDNVIMRHCIEKAGFRYCGIIHLLNGDPRLAFQKLPE